MMKKTFGKSIRNLLMLFLPLALLVLTVRAQQTPQQPSPEYKLITPKVVAQGETFTARMVELTSKGHRPLDKGKKLLINDQLISIGEGGKVEIPSFVKEGSQFIITQVLTPAVKQSLPMTAEHVVVIPQTETPFPTEIADVPEIIPSAGSDQPFRIRGQGLDKLEKAALVGPSGQRIDLVELFGSPYEHIYFMPEDVNIPKGEYRFKGWDAKGNAYEAASLSFSSTLEFSGPKIRRRGQTGTLRVTADVDGTAQITGGGPIIRITDSRVFELRKNKTHKVKFIARQVGDYNATVQLFNPEDAPVLSQTPVQAKPQPVETHYNARLNQTEVKAPVRISDETGKPMKDIAVDMVLSHPKGVEFAHVMTDGDGFAKFSRSLPGNIVATSLSSYVYSVPGLLFAPKPGTGDTMNQQDDGDEDEPENIEGPEEIYIQDNGNNSNTRKVGITVTPDSDGIGALCTASVRYEIDIWDDRVPNGVYIDAKHDDGTWHGVTFYRRIPNTLNPLVGFDIRFGSSNPNVGGPGYREFRVRWTLDGDPLGTPQKTTVLLGPKPPPTSVVEEIDDDSSCCIWRIIVWIDPNATYNRAGQAYVHEFARNMQFDIEMKNAMDAAKVRVIQYWKNEEYLIYADQSNEQTWDLDAIEQPNPDPGWQWTPGNDGGTVDSDDTNRCYPLNHVTGRHVRWSDYVSISKEHLQANLNRGGDRRTYPRGFKTLYKTDIFCSDRDVCDERVAQNQESPIASILWRVNFKFEVNMVNGVPTIEGKRDEILIESITPRIYRWCPDSPFKQEVSEH